MNNLGPFFPAFRHILAPMGPRSSPPCQRVPQATLSQIEARLGPAVPSHLFENPDSVHFSRDRIFSLSRTFWCWTWQIFQSNCSCRAVVRQVQALFSTAQAGSLVDEGTAAYCAARAKLSLPWLLQIFRAVFQRAEQACPPATLLQARPVRAIDGSGARLANTPLNRQKFPPSKNLPPNTGFPYLRVVCLFSAVSGAILSQVTGSLFDSELRLALGLLPSLRKNDILVGDRAYGIFLFAALLPALGGDLIARVSAGRRIDFRKAKVKFSHDDCLVCWKKPQRCSKMLDLQKWQQLPQELTVRIIRFTIQARGFRTQNLTIVTTLLDAALYPAEEILAAYFKRWRMEMCFDDIKTTLKMELLSCRSPEMVQKELVVFLTAHNFLRWIMATAATTHEVDLERISFKGTLDGFREWNQAIAQLGVSRRYKRKRVKLWEDFLQTLAADLIPKRPGRREPRAVKKRSKYPHMNKPRDRYVDRMSREKRRRMATARKKAGLK